MAFKGRFFSTAYIIGIVVYFIYAVYLFVAEDGVLDWINKHNAENIAGTMKAEKPWIEETREFFGILILLVVLLINYFYFKRKGKNRRVV
jgi:hypothetical protein